MPQSDSQETAPKVIVFCFDGTGNEPSDAKNFEDGGSISNILKLRVMLDLKDCFQQSNGNGNVQNLTCSMHYYPGIGTREHDFKLADCILRMYAIKLLMNWGMHVVNFVKRIINMAFALKTGDVRRILDAANSDWGNIQYEEGDILLVFGFSRGAALARKFASDLLGKEKNVKINFLGVFDTVAAMNGVHSEGERIGEDVVFENGTVKDGILKAVHILSLDEDRVAFEPTLMDLPHDNPDNSGRILEVWFPGVHSDVGGGYWHDGLSDLALEFMLQECEKELQTKNKISINADEKLIKSKLQALGFDHMSVDDFEVRPQHKGKMHLHPKKTATGILKRFIKQEPSRRSVVVWKNNKPAEPATKDDEFPLIHHSAKKRFDDVPGYRPVALRGLSFRLLDETGNIKKVNGIAELRKV